MAYEDVSLESRGKVHRSPYPHAESFYRQIVSNYEQAAKWRVPRVRRPSAKPAQLAGRWLRITVGESGVFRVTGEDLQQAGIALDEVDPQTLRLLYGGGEALSEEVVQPPSAWKEMGLVVEDGGDGRFDPADYVLFYGEAAQRWEYDSEEVDYVWREPLHGRQRVLAGFRRGYTGKEANATQRRVVPHGSREARPLSRVYSQRGRAVYPLSDVWYQVGIYVVR